jgi:hypothetical protein
VHDRRTRSLDRVCGKGRRAYDDSYGDERSRGVPEHVLTLTVPFAVEEDSEVFALKAARAGMSVGR